MTSDIVVCSVKNLLGMYYVSKDKDVFTCFGRSKESKSTKLILGPRTQNLRILKIQILGYNF